MAGFFGLFNYEKEGPGISKNEPSKRGFFRFFEFYFRNFWKLCVNSIVYSVISIPLLTSGLANVGITNIARSIARDKHSFGFSDFLDTIKKNWKQGLIVGIINMIFYALLIFDIIFFFQAEKSTATTLFLGISFFALFLLTVMNYYIWTLIITFDFSIKQLYVNSFKFVILNLKNNFICFFSLLAVLSIFVGILFLTGKSWIVALIFELLILGCTYPGFKALLIQFCTFPAIKKFIIDPYYDEHPDADIQKRIDLGLIDQEEYYADTEENFFGDSESND